MAEKYNWEYDEVLECFLVIADDGNGSNDIVLTITWDHDDKDGRNRAESKAVEICERLRSGQDKPEKFDQGHLEV